MALARAEAAELATVGAQAARLGVTIDVAEAVQKGVQPDALRASVLNQLAMLLGAEKNGSAPLPTGTSAGATAIVRPAKRNVRTAQRD